MHGWDEYLYWFSEAKRFRVYYCRDAAGVMIYIGYSGDWKGRERAHHYCTPWWSEVAKVTFSPWMNRRDAIAYEARAIRLNRPRLNVQHNPDVRRAA